MWCILLALVPLSRWPDAQAPDPQRVREALVELEKAFKSDASGDRIRAIDASAAIENPEVIAWIGKGLRDGEIEVRRSAIEALRWNGHDAARKELHELVAEDRALRKQPTLFAGVLRGIGQHGHPDSIDILRDDPWSAPDGAVIQARILGLARIRSAKSVEALIDLMKIAGRHKIQPFMEDFRLALRVLTGADLGESQDQWLAWWNDNRGKIRVAPEVGELPKAMKLRWNLYWNAGRRGERFEKRGAGR